MSEDLREKATVLLREIRRQAHDIGWANRSVQRDGADWPTKRAHALNDSRLAAEVLQPEDDAILALLPTGGEPVGDTMGQARSWRRVYELCRDLGMNETRFPRTEAGVTGCGTVLDFIRHLATPQESAEAVEWVRHAMTKYHGMRHAIGKYMWARGETILGEQIEGLPPEESAEVEDLRGSLEEWKLDFKAMEAEVERLRSTLEEIARVGGFMDTTPFDDDTLRYARCQKIARAALNTETP